jgi:hypothetical protein
MDRHECRRLSASCDADKAVQHFLVLSAHPAHRATNGRTGKANRVGNSNPTVGWRYNSASHSRSETLWGLGFQLRHLGCHPHRGSNRGVPKPDVRVERASTRMQTSRTTVQFVVRAARLNMPGPFRRAVRTRLPIYSQSQLLLNPSVVFNFHNYLSGVGRRLL